MKSKKTGCKTLKAIIGVSLCGIVIPSKGGDDILQCQECHKIMVMSREDRDRRYPGSILEWMENNIKCCSNPRYLFPMISRVTVEESK